MTFEIHDNTEIAAIWFIDAAHEGFDWMCSLVKQGNEGKWEFKYRFRYYKGDPTKDPFTDDDEKSWTRGGAPDGTDEAKAELTVMLRLIATKLAEACGGEVDESLDLGFGMEALTKCFEDKPWAHMQTGVDLGGNKGPVLA